VPQCLLAVDDLRVSYGHVRALDGISLEVQAGSAVAVLGNNGAGKSTLLRAISGSLPSLGGRLDSGRILLKGAALPASAQATVRHGVVLVPEGRHVFSRLSVEENLRAGAFGAPRGAYRRAVDRVGQLFPILAERGRQPAGLLSGGEQQMLAIARGLMSEPELLMLDEPSLGLAPRVVEQIAQIIASIRAAGTTVLLVEQNARMALALADYGYVLELGSVTLSGPGRRLAADDRIRGAYLGTDTDDARRPPAPPAASGTGTVLGCDSVSVDFGGVPALREVSLELAPGSLQGVVGPNGAGKSTLLNVLSGVVMPSGGRVQLGTKDLTGLAPHRITELGLGRTFQTPVASAALTVEHSLLLGRHHLDRTGIVAAGLRLPRVRRRETQARRYVSDIAERVGLGSHLHEPVGSLSYGQRKRADLARAACAEPSVLLLDEPVAGMNAGERVLMAQLILQLCAERELAVLLVEHDMKFIGGLCQTVSVLNFGRRIAYGTPAAIGRDRQVIDAYLGGAPQEVPT
jgi:ABC-type branched-subunit amino acid transport system ATPase component